MKDEKNKANWPTKYDTEDTIYNECVISIKEFPEYITNYKDIEHWGHTKVVSKAFQNLRMDSVYERSDGSLINIEHHSSLNEIKLARNLDYITTLHRATLKDVEPFIMYTGKLPVKKTLYLNYKDAFTPNFFITKFQNGETSLNNLKYKLENDKKISPFDVLDLIWLPSFDIEINKENLVVELSKIYDELEISNSLSEVAQSCLILWASKYVKKQANIDIVEEKLHMSITQKRSMEEKIRNARIDGMLTRAEERGEENGIKIGEKNGARKKEEEMIKTLLKTQDAKKVAEMLECDIEKIREIENNTETPPE